MKNTAFVCFLMVACYGLTSVAQTTATTQGNYVIVIGSFTLEANATKFAKFARKQKYQSEVELYNNRYHVIVLQTDDHDKVIAEVKKLQQSGPFRDAWVFTRKVPEPVVIPVVEQPKEEVIIVPEVKKPPVMTHADSVKMKEDKIKADVDKNVMLTKKGEMAKLDNIFFYKDASVLKPESRFAVDKLVTIMNENPSMKIKIHGHTNGDDPGKIIRRANDQSDFFSLENTVEDYGSSKELSEQRADVIRDYLVSKGIDSKRMSIKAWGGKKPIYRVDDDKAAANVRVEIEVVHNE